MVDVYQTVIILVPNISMNVSNLNEKYETSFEMGALLFDPVRFRVKLGPWYHLLVLKGERRPKWLETAKTEAQLYLQ